MQPELLLSGQLCTAVSGARIALLGQDEACCESLYCCMLQQQQRVDLQAKHRSRRHKARSLSTHTFRLLWRSVVRLAWDSEMRVMRVTFQTWKISSCASLTGATKLCSPDIIHTVLLIDVCPWMQDDLKQLLGMPHRSGQLRGFFTVMYKTERITSHGHLPNVLYKIRAITHSICKYAGVAL